MWSAEFEHGAYSWTFVEYTLLLKLLDSVRVCDFRHDSSAYECNSGEPETVLSVEGTMVRERSMHAYKTTHIQEGESDAYPIVKRKEKRQRGSEIPLKI